MISRLVLVLGAAAAMLLGVIAPAQAGPSDTNLRHSCTLVGASAAGIQGVTCADIWTNGVSSPWAGGEAICQRVSDNVTVECAGAQQYIELWNATKNKRVAVSTTPGACGSYTGYGCTVSGRNYFDLYGAQIIGCDQAYVVVRTTIRLPGSGLYRTAAVRTTNYRNGGCFP